jgi:hypothetical protein
MKYFLSINALIFCALTVNSQNLNNDQLASNNIVTQQVVNYNNLDMNDNIQIQTSNRGNSSAVNRFSNKSSSNIAQNTQPKVIKQTNNSQIKNDKVITINSNPGNSNPKEVKQNTNTNDAAVATNTEPNNTYNVFHTANNQPKIIIDSPGLDFKPIGLTGRDYSNGGKLKKGQKNFYRTPKTKKPKHKSKPRFIKLKYRTTGCANW